MSLSQEKLNQRLYEFRKKYYTDKIIRGSLILSILIFSILFVVLLSEGIFGFSANVRTGLVFSLGAVFIGVLGYMVLWPASQYWNLTRGLSDWQIAELVQRYFPTINDKLLNFLQLRSQSVGSQNLAAAAIERKAAEIAPVSLSSAINLKLNLRYAWYLLIPLLLFMITSISSPGLLGGAAFRMSNFEEEFVPPPPFQISLQPISEQVIAGEDISLAVKVEGDELPSELFVFVRNDETGNSEFLDYSLKKISNTKFEYTLSDVKQNFSFYLGNAEVKTAIQEIEVLKRPFIRNFQAYINYPAYTGLKPEKVESNVGDLKVLKGSSIRWEIKPDGEVASASFNASNSQPKLFEISDDGKAYRYSQRIMNPLDYFISLISPKQIQNVDTVNYKIGLVQDRYPSIYIFSPNNDFLIDLDPEMPLELEIGDDFGFSRMELNYRFVKSGGTSQVSETYKVYPLVIDRKVLLQQKSYTIDLTSLGLSEGDELEYFIKVWDNDNISGPKAATSATYKAIYPTLDAKYEEVSSQQNAIEDQLKSLKENSDELKKSYDKMQEKLLNQKKLNFDDKKELQRMLEQQQNMMKEISEAQKKFEETKDQLQENQMISEQTLKKYEDLNKLMEEMKDPELEKLLEEIQDKMENMNPEDLKNQLDQMQQINEEDIKKSLERTLELLKQLEVDQKVDEIRNKLNTLEAKQRVLEEKTNQAEGSEEMESLENRQDALNEQMEAVQDDLEELAELKSETDSPDQEKMDDLQSAGEEAQDNMEKASDQMNESAQKMQDENRKSQKQAGQSQQGASKSQKSAADKMEEMSESLMEMQSSSQSQQDQQNLDDLRDLLENLLKLSFDQEDLRDEVKDLSYGDPALKEKGQQQKKLQDDMSLVRDSLESLANKVAQIQKFVLDESRSITNNMQRSQTFFRNKQVPMITFHQQESMTSINNLANMLSDVMKQMQAQMKANQNQEGAMCNKPNGKKPSNMKGISKQQKQLNQQMQQMMNQGVNPDKLSEMAAQQEAIRKQLQEAHDRIKQEGGKSLGDLNKIQQDMEDTEDELRNKQLTHEMLMRQKQILSRLLQAEQSVRERELDDKRESKTGRELDRKSPDELTLEEYKNKIRQELLKSNQLEYSNDFLILIEEYYKKLEKSE